MNKSLLFLPDISGFTEFVRNTEIDHSQHIISELLEILIDSNILDMQLAEIEGDALFLFKEEEIPSLEKLLSQVETMFTAFYSHLKLLEKNRVCPCNACSSAPYLQLKIILHCGELQFINVQSNRKPFGMYVIEAHRLMKNSINSDNYALISKPLSDDIELSTNYQSKLFDFELGENEYDGRKINYIFSEINKEELKLRPFAQAKKVSFDRSPSIYFKKKFPVSASNLLEYITNYAHRYEWIEGVDKFEYDENEVTRIGTEHVCVINGKHLNFITITKKGKPGQLVYGELTTDAPPVDKLYQFYVINPLAYNSCMLEVEIYWEVKSLIKKIILKLITKKLIYKNIEKVLENLFLFVNKSSEN